MDILLTLQREEPHTSTLAAFLQLDIVNTWQDKKDKITSIIYHRGRSTLNLSAVVQTSCCCITGCRQRCCKTQMWPHYPVSTNPSNTFHLGSALCYSYSLHTHSIKLIDWTVLRLQVQCPVKTALEISHLGCHKGHWLPLLSLCTPPWEFLQEAANRGVNVLFFCPEDDLEMKKKEKRKLINNTFCYNIA